MTMTLSSATAAAKAAQAELTAPVAANNSAAANAAAVGGSRGATTPAKASGNNANSANSANNASTSNTAKGNATAHAATAQSSQKPAAAAGQQPERSNGNASVDAAAQAKQANQAAQAAASTALPVAAPLFAQLLNLADVAAAPDDSTDSTTPADCGDATGSGSGAASAVLPAMLASMLNLAPAPQAAAVSTAGDADTARIDAVSAGASLNTSATRLNLAAVGVAVNPAAQAADDAAAASAAAAAAAAAAQIAAPVAVAPTAANNAALAAAAAREAKTDAPAAAPATVQPGNGSEPVAPVVQRAVTPEAASYAAVPRSAPRVADTAMPATPVASAAGAAASADDGNSSLPVTANVNGVNVGQSAAPASGQAAATVKLAGSPEQWQQPLREALGDRLQVQLQRNNDHAVIRLEPPNMGAIEISIRHSAGSLQINLSANNSEVVRQLNTISDNVRQDLSSRQFADVAVTVSSSRAQAQADQGGRNGQQRDQNDGRTPGRALSEDDSAATFAMTGE